MKISLNAIKEFTKVELPIEELVAKIGAQLGAVDEVTDLGAKYQGIVVAKVVACEKHPDADKLSLCKIDDGGVVADVPRDENGYVQVVCGAPNVKAGLLVAWLPPGATVPHTFTAEPYVLEARDIRGQRSNGMLASPKELDLGDSHAGILELDVVETDGQPTIKPGDDFAATYGLDDHIIEIENKMFTHRPDAFGQLGVAREIAGILGQKFESPAIYKAPKTTGSTAASESHLLVVENEVPELVPRFIAQVFKKVSIGPSPVWMQAYLSRLGVRPINNVVDITNYFLLLTGQPLHAFDYDKVKALDPGADHATLVVRFPHENEKIKLLNDKEVDPRQEAIIIASATKAISIAGVMGGKETEVDDQTKNIILECASFDMYSIRRTSMAHGLFTDAVTRFTKGQSPLQNDRVLAWAAHELICDSGALPDTTIHDHNSLASEIIARDSLYLPVSITAEFINSRLGLTLSAEQIQGLLENVEFSVKRDGGETLTVTAPFWRTDIELREDVVEEVGRLYGYDKLPLQLPQRDLIPATRDKHMDTKARIRQSLSKAGANEILTYSFVPANLLVKVGQNPAQAFEISNALSPELQYYRMSLMPSLLEKIHPNSKAGFDRFALFELGKTHGLDNGQDDEGLPREFEFTALVVTASDKVATSGAAYYQARKYLETLVNEFASVNLEFKPISPAMENMAVVQPYDPARAALVSIAGGDFLGIIGEFKPAVRRALKLPKYTAGFEVDTDVLQAQLAHGRTYVSLPRYPSVKQDITLKVGVDRSYAEIATAVSRALRSVAPEAIMTHLELLDIYQKAADSKHKQFTFRITLTDANRTLTDKEATTVLDGIANETHETLQAERI